MGGSTMTDWKDKTAAELVTVPGSTPSHAASTEMARRLLLAIDDLKNTLRAEEVAIKRLTRWLVGMTAVLVVLTVALVWLTVMLYFKRGG
jgi:hypothetical protein